MSTPYLGQITSFAFNFPPKNWALCNGQLMAISQNQALFSLLGTTYGGDGRTTFALPNLQGSFPTHFGTDTSTGNAVALGQVGGEVNHTLLLNEMAQHTHPMLACSAVGTSGTPVGNFPAPAANGQSLFASPSNTTLGTGSSFVGGGQAHNNMPPYLVINFCIALSGIFPSRN
jgi:microcystin-dependent protein